MTISESEYQRIVQAMASVDGGDHVRDLLTVIDTTMTLSGSDLSITDATNIIVGTSTGTKIGTAAAQKLGFFGATPVVQRTKAGHNNWAALSDVVTALVELGFFDAA